MTEPTHENPRYDKQAERVAVAANAEFIEPIREAMDAARKDGHGEILEEAERFWQEHPRASLSSFIREMTP